MSADAGQGKGGDGGDAGQGGAGDGKSKGDAGDKGGQNPDVQKAIDRVIARERADAEKREATLKQQLEGTIAELRTQLEAVGKQKGGKDGEFEAAVAKAREPLQQQLDATTKTLQALRGRIAGAELKSVAADLSVDPDTVAQLLGTRVRLTDEGAVEVIDAQGRPEYGAGGAKTVKELVGELLMAKPFLAKSKARDGIDFQQGDRKTTSGRTADELRAEIAELEKAGKWNDALRLQSQLHQLVGVHKAKTT